MLFADITILDDSLTPQDHCYVATEKDRIAYVGKTPPAGDFGRTVTGKGKLLMAGFFNAHAHSPMTLLRGYGENLPLDCWLTERIFPFEAKMNGDSFYWGTLLAMAESLRYGIVSTTDMYNGVDEIVRAVTESGVKMNLGRAIVNFSEASLADLPSFAELKHGIETYHGSANGRILMDSSLHAEYTNPEATIRDLATYTKGAGVRMHVHVSETKKEHEECKTRHDGRTPVQFLADCGLFDVPTTAAHCVFIEGEDYDILEDKGVTVAVNPISNLKLASGVCDVPALQRRDIRVAIGTDSVASNNSLNFLEETKVFAIAPKMMYHAPEAVSPKEALRAATLGGALAQGRTDSGSLREGNKADLIVLDIDTPWMVPVHDLPTNLVYSASGSDVVMTVVDGEVLYEDGEWTTIDVEKVCAEARKETKRILDAL